MSTTPRTDAARGFHDMDTAVSAEDMARLEIELTESKADFKEERRFLIAEIKELNAELDHLRAELALREAEYLMGALRMVTESADRWQFRAEKAEAECLEQARLLGLSGNEVATLRSAVFRLSSLWHQLFFLLDITEESDSGNAFKPNYFSSCRIADAESMEKILTNAKHELNAGVNKQYL